MTGYGVQIEEIRGAGRAARSAAEQRGAVNEAGVLDEIRHAMVGSRSTELVALVGVAWRQASDYWGGTMGGHAEALGQSADAYLANEEAAAQDFRVFSGDSGNAKPI